VRAGDSLAAIARAYGVTVTAIAETNNIQDVNAIHVGQELAIPDPARVPTGPIVQPPPPVGDGGQTAVTSVSTLEQLPDTDPGPPITIQISAVRIKENGNYQVTGWVHNDGAQVYGGIGVIATFFTELECGEYYVQNQGRKGQAGSGSVEYGCAPNWHGPVKVYATCPLLAPGAECPFSLEIYPRDYVSYHLHPEGTPVEYREPAAVELSGVQVVDTGSNTVRITGTATNANPFKVKNVIVSGVLLNAGGQIVSAGSSFGLKEDIEPGASVRFDLRLEKERYTSYQLYAQAERDWD
jgi:LysM repeat protein